MEGETLLSAATKAGMELDSVCGGKGTCGRCRLIVNGLDQPLTEDERKHLTEAEIAKGVRLACQVYPQEGLVVEVPSAYLRGKQVILEEYLADVDIDPPVTSTWLDVSPPSLENQEADMERLMRSLPQDGRATISLDVLRKLPNVLKDGPIRVFLRDGEILDVDNGGGGPLGVAVDIGTTTVVAYLVDMENGETLSVRSAMNPQISQGDDVISRITYTMQNPEGLHHLQEEIVNCLNGLITGCVTEAVVDIGRIREVVIVGNTAMHHLFFGLDPASLALAPYVPVTQGALSIRGNDLGLFMGNGYVHSPPNIAGFVGADHMAVLLASRLWECDRPTLVIDIGTNGEISLGCDGDILSASCAAGPAFEGASLRCGIRGVPGAIDHVRIDEDVEYTTIGGAGPVGLCGSGVVDAVWELLKAGYIDNSGRILEETESPRIRVVSGESEFVLAWADETATGASVVITQNDIVSIQYAKSALYVGATLLMEEMGVEAKDIDRVLLAGAFGNYVSVESTRNIGVIPEVPLERIESIGNAAGSGARMTLLDRKCRDRAEELAGIVRYMELAAHPQFEERFYEAMFLPHLDQELFPEVSSELRGRGT